MYRAFCVVAALSLLVGCGGESSKNNGSGNNGAANNGATNGGDATNGATANNTAPNNGASNNGGTTNGATNNATSNQTNTTNNTASYTWHKDVRPIIEANCESCHFDGGIGPFPLTTYQEVSDLGALVKAATSTGSMPVRRLGMWRRRRVIGPAVRSAYGVS